MQSAETAYLFRHALLRDVAYELQPPGQRARLHELAFHLIEQAFGGRAPETPPLDSPDSPDIGAHTTDPVASELWQHACAAEAGNAPTAIEPACLALYARRAAELAEKAYQLDVASRVWLQFASLLQGAPRAIALRRAATTLFLSGRTAEARPLVERAVAELTSCGPGAQLAYAQGMLGALHATSGRVDDSETAYRQALQGHREAGNRRGEGQVLANLAVSYANTGRAAEAEAQFKLALAVIRETGARRSEAILLGNLAGLYHSTGRHAESEAAYDQALAVFRDLGDLRYIGITLADRAIVYRDTGRIADAEKSYLRGLEYLARAGDRRAEAGVQANYAVLLGESGRDRESEALLEVAVPRLREAGDYRLLAIALSSLGIAQQKRGDHNHAETHFVESVEILRRVRARHYESISLGNLAGLYRATGRTQQAVPLLEQAIAISREGGHRDSEGTFTCVLAVCRLEIAGGTGVGTEIRETWLQGFAMLSAPHVAARRNLVLQQMRDACARVGVAAFEERKG